VTNTNAGTTQATRVVEGLCRFIESVEHVPSLDELASRAGLSRWHLQRTFKRIAGVTPKAYADACRERRLRDQGLGRVRVPPERVGVGPAGGGPTPGRELEMTQRE